MASAPPGAIAHGPCALEITRTLGKFVGVRGVESGLGFNLLTFMSAMTGSYLAWTATVSTGSRRLEFLSSGPDPGLRDPGSLRGGE